MEEEHFDAAQFRRSAALLDDEFGGDNFSARPPTMIARHNMTHAPSAPPVTYSNHFAANTFAHGDPYASPDNFPTNDPFNQYNAYPTYTQEPVYGLNPGNSFPPSNPIANSDSAGSAAEMDPTTAHNTYLNRQPTLRETDNHATDQQYLDMDRVASPPTSATPMHAPAEYDSGLFSPTSAAPLYNPHDAIEYPSAGATSAPTLAPSHEPTVHEAAPKRPETVYDPEDAYGGM
jgi:hypothetical protein